MATTGFSVKNRLKEVIDYARNPDKTTDKKFLDEDLYAALRYVGNVAYHGYQSFVSGEVTSEEAHQIGLETARRMWGKDYEIVVTTHLNTDNLHNHIVVNSVSFRTVGNLRTIFQTTTS